MTTTCYNADRIRERSVLRALQKGLRPEESTGNLRWYFDHLRRFEKNASTIRIYGSHAYIFQEDTLSAVYALPNEYKADMQQAMYAREESLHNATA